ncbi:MAG: hypothetical protein LBD12_02060 [Clostridiales Family XIII bacterium]|jgi:hypothetical protein|nr:hypothetical protein [Clostridiales Family XIII bacterium]
MTAKRQVVGCILLAAAMVIAVVLLARMEIVRVETDRERQRQYELTSQEAERINRNSNLGLEYMSVLEGYPTPDDMPWDMDRGHPMAIAEDGLARGYYLLLPLSGLRFFGFQGSLGCRWTRTGV